MAVYTWGKASEGQLGLGGIEEAFITTPTLSRKLTEISGKVKEIACGWEHTAFLTVDGTVYTCGNNKYGQLGHEKGQTMPGKLDSACQTAEFAYVRDSTIIIL